ncbi:DUF1376 domain-containing protein [Agrobacterium vitis]|uniref:DUF1376 domain-containing protein n=1 Tax=Agrobacterium vitis TaxID=373 RepID=UPI0012E70C85|nr:DUF1376 domain-containing protein [Agrobacterium vitis]MVA47276.1 DUF1376 domain-containing protein [Agrobacterium vitis]
MSKRLAYHRRYHAEALEGFRGLTLEQRGAYQTILDLIYDNGGPLEYRERWLAGQLNCSVRKARSLVTDLVELGKLYMSDDHMIANRRADIELLDARAVYDATSRAAAEREERKRATKQADFAPADRHRRN